MEVGKPDARSGIGRALVQIRLSTVYPRPLGDGTLTSQIGFPLSPTLAPTPPGAVVAPTLTRGLAKTRKRLTPPESGTAHEIVVSIGLTASAAPGAGAASASGAATISATTSQRSTDFMRVDICERDAIGSPPK